MSEMESAARALFDTYRKLADDALKSALTDKQVNELAGMFADFAVGSSPQGVHGAALKDLAGIMKTGQENYRKVGGKSFEITGLRIEKIDPIHAAVHVDWDFGYTNGSGKSGHVGFTNIYYLTYAGGTPKIFAFITPDEEKAMKEHGLV